MTDNTIFSAFERELIDAARLILSDGVERLKTRQNLLPTNRHNRNGRNECREARDTLTASLIADYGTLRHEVAVAVLIDAQGRLIAIEQFPQGKATSVEIRRRILAEWVVHHGASAVLLAHNHPSGDNTPSRADERLTAELAPWLAAMECELVDHLVINSDGASSIMGGW